MPPARFVDLGERGHLLVRDVGHRPSDADRPVVILLHGWTATADLNFFTCYDALAADHRVVAFDHRGHGTGLRTTGRFSLEDCADDAAAVAEALDIDRFVAVGYSMGGAIAQLTWKRHPDRVRGLVLGATAAAFSDHKEERRGFRGLSGLATLARYTPDSMRHWLTEQLYLQRKSGKWEPWAMQEAASHDWRMVLEAGSAIGSFSSRDWLEEVDVPTSVILTMADNVVPLARQAELHARIPAAKAFRVDGAHDAIVANADHFVPALLAAVESVEVRSR